MINPKIKFFLFGMGTRKKYLYQNGKLVDLISSEILYTWDIISEKIIPYEYKVILELNNGAVCEIAEDESSVFICSDGEKTVLSESRINLPDFSEYEHPEILRTLHHEILVNITPSGPVPNLFVYRKPWYRDSAMMYMCLEKTGNLHLVKDWITSIDEMYDRNNSGICEPDNLGQILYLISLIADKENLQDYPIVKKILDEAERISENGHLTGLSDFSEHPVYQTKWLKFGLKKLGLEDRYVIPEVYDSYSSLFWWDFKDQHISGNHFGESEERLYPYLTWAEHHFYGLDYPCIPDKDSYPLTWEAEASQADYSGIKILDSENHSYADKKTAAPHTWHAAEMFLYLIEK